MSDNVSFEEDQEEQVLAEHIFILNKTGVLLIRKKERVDWRYVPLRAKRMAEDRKEVNPGSRPRSDHLELMWHI